MKKKFSPMLLLTAFVLSLFMSMSLKALHAQEVLYNSEGQVVTPPVDIITTTGTAENPGTIGVIPGRTATGGTIGATNTTATGGTIGVTAIKVPATDVQQSGNLTTPNICVDSSTQGKICGVGAVLWCTKNPLVDNCQKIINDINAKKY
ncbi:MAG: hypothetical protein H7281_01395 [Bacteriovorax sp.]|nr:hypothetical protein [Bacteriovorax sp.]